MKIQLSASTMGELDPAQFEIERRGKVDIKVSHLFDTNGYRVFDCWSALFNVVTRTCDSSRITVASGSNVDSLWDKKTCLVTPFFVSFYMVRLSQNAVFSTSEIACQLGLCLFGPRNTKFVIKKLKLATLLVTIKAVKQFRRLQVSSCLLYTSPSPRD